MSGLDFRAKVMRGDDLSLAEIQALTALVDLDSPEPCREMSCMYHGDRNEARDALRRFNERTSLSPPAQREGVE